MGGQYDEIVAMTTYEDIDTERNTLYRIHVAAMKSGKVFEYIGPGWQELAPVPGTMAAHGIDTRLEINSEYVQKIWDTHSVLMNMIEECDVLLNDEKDSCVADIVKMIKNGVYVMQVDPNSIDLDRKYTLSDFFDFEESDIGPKFWHEIEGKINMERKRQERQ